MPLVKIDIVKGARTRDEIKKLAASIQEVMIEHFAAPKLDRYQVNDLLY